MKAEKGKCIRNCLFSKSQTSISQQKCSSAIGVMVHMQKPRKVIFYLQLENNEKCYMKATFTLFLAAFQSQGIILTDQMNL